MNEQPKQQHGQWNRSIYGLSATWIHFTPLFLTAQHKQVLQSGGMSRWVEKVTPWCQPTLKYAKYLSLTGVTDAGRHSAPLQPILGCIWGRPTLRLLTCISTHSHNPSYDSNRHLLPCFWSTGSQSTAFKLIKNKAWREQRECEGEKQLLQLSHGTHPRGQLLMYYYQSSMESWQNVFLRQTGVW